MRKGKSIFSVVGLFLWRCFCLLGGKKVICESRGRLFSKKKSEVTYEGGQPVTSEKAWRVPSRMISPSNRMMMAFVSA